jgi:hypothetical protein
MSDKCLPALAFRAWHVGGISRAWRRWTEAGGYILITDPSGHDLPEDTGPYLLWRFSANDELLTDEITIDSLPELRRFLTDPAGRVSPEEV